MMKPLTCSGSTGLIDWFAHTTTLHYGLMILHSTQLKEEADRWFENNYVFHYLSERKEREAFLFRNPVVVCFRWKRKRPFLFCVCVLTRRRENPPLPGFGRGVMARNESRRRRRRRTLRNHRSTGKLIYFTVESWFVWEMAAPFDVHQAVHQAVRQKRAVFPIPDTSFLRHVFSSVSKN